MSVIINDMFYSRLPVKQIALRELLMEDHLFYIVPDNLHVEITDVKKSTKAVADGLHETVNLVAIGSLEAVLNIAGKTYLTQGAELSDTLVMDGRINTVISGNKPQSEMLQPELNEMEKSGEVSYGFHVSKESVMSCCVRDMNEEHIHFVDGAEGGYTKAAGILKEKIFVR